MEQPEAGAPAAIWVLDALYRNGAVHLTLQLAQRLGARSGRLVKVQPLEPDREVTLPAGVQVTPLAPAGRLRMVVGPALSRLVRLARQADVIVACSEIGIGLLLSAAAARATRTPLVVAVHADLDAALQEWMPRRSHRLFRLVHRHVAGAICVSPALVVPLVRNGLPADRIRVVQNGIDIAAVRAAAEAPVPDAAGDEGPIAIATGRVTHQKGYDVLVRAHAGVVSEVPHELRIYNDGPLLPSIRDLVDELGVTGSVSFVDPAEPVLPHVARATVFCLPSRHEGLPLALLEAVALGVPCIAANCSDGVEAALDGGRVGDLVEVEDVDGFAAALRAHLVDPGPLRAKAALGPEHARSFDMDVMTQGWMTALTELTRSRLPNR